MHIPGGAVSFNLRSGGHPTVQMEPLYRTQRRYRSRGATIASSATQQSILPEPFFTPTVAFCVAACVEGCMVELPGTVTFWA